MLLSDNRLGASNFSEKVEGIKVKLADFGCALRVGEVYPAIVGTSEYRAPELLLESPYGVGIDIWATACLLVELATGKYLFRPDSSPNVLKEEKHLALMTKLLGPVPQDMVRSGRAGRSFYNKRTGELHHFPLHSLQNEDLTTLLGVRRGKAEDKDEAFSQFLLPLLEFRPEMRITAEGALEHPFIGGSADAARGVVVKNAWLSVLESLYMRDMRTEGALFQPKVMLKKLKVGEAAGLDGAGHEARAKDPTEESVEILQYLSKYDVPQVTKVAVKKSVPVKLSKEELKKLAGKKVKKGEDEYVILVPGVKTGLCGKYWSNPDADASPRKHKARKQPF